MKKKYQRQALILLLVLLWVNALLGSNHLIVVLCVGPEEFGIETGRLFIILGNGCLHIVGIVGEFIAWIRQSMSRLGIAADLCICSESHFWITCPAHYIPCFQLVHKTEVKP